MSAPPLQKKHKFKSKTFTKFTYCNYCSDFIFGVVKQGQKCVNPGCEYNAHHRCAPLVETDCCAGENVVKREFTKQPSVMAGGHFWVETYFRSPVFCDICSEFVFGVAKSQGYQCKNCRMKIHRPCHLSADRCEKANDKDPNMLSTGGCRSERSMSESASISTIDSMNPDSFIGKYDLGSTILGRGQFGVVMECTSRETQIVYAVKIINLRAFLMRPTVIDIFRREIKVMLKCSHPGIVNLIENFESPKKMELVLDLCQGGDLSDFVELPEYDSKILFWQTLVAVQYLHRSGIVHRDLKPANILVLTDENAPPLTRHRLKVADFGFAKTLEDGDKTHTVAGTRAYLAPEILLNAESSGYGHSCDMWSMGIILYRMIDGELPYDESQIGQLHILQPQFDATPWANVSEEAKEFIRKLLIYDPAHRYSSDDAVMDSWGRTSELLTEYPPMECGSVQINSE